MVAVSSVVTELFAETRSVIDAALKNHAQSDLFDGLSEKLASGSSARQVATPTQSVVDQWLSEAVEAAAGPWTKLASLIGQAAPHVPWLGSYQNLESSPELEAFRAHYSYQVLASPLFRGHEPPVKIDGLLVGFSLQAPNVFYPQHHHEPPELYGVISGTLDWQVGDHWSRKGPGDITVHRSHESHAMRTGDQPVLTWVAWPSHPDCDVFMPSLDPPDKTMAPTSYFS